MDFNLDEITIGLGNIAWSKPEKDEFVIYIGRGNKPSCCHAHGAIGNPFSVKDFGRDKAIKLFEVYLEDSYLDNIVNIIEEQYKQGYKKFIFMCYCIPKPCHGEIVRREVFRILREKYPEENLEPTNDKFVFSGGNLGADFTFGTMAKKYGYDVINFYCGLQSSHNSPCGNRQVSNLDYEQGKKELAKAAKYIWGYQFDTLDDQEIINYWSGIKQTKQVYIVGTSVSAGQSVSGKLKDNRKYRFNFIKGKSGLIAAMAILNFKEVFFYDQVENQWYEYDHLHHEFTYVNGIPKLSKMFTCTGDILNTDGIKAVNDLFINMYGEK